MTAREVWYGKHNWPLIEQALYQYVPKELIRRGVRLCNIERLGGGAIQDNLLLQLSCSDNGGDEVQSPRQITWVMRCNTQAQLDISLDRKCEFELTKLVYAHGVCVAKPLAYFELETLGKQCFLMEYVPGEARGYLLVNEQKTSFDRAQLVRDIASNMARLHSIDTRELGSLSLQYQCLPEQVEQLYQSIATHKKNMPAVELCYQFLRLYCDDGQVQHIAHDKPCMQHGDFRTGNILVNVDGYEHKDELKNTSKSHAVLSAILDWEFCHLGNYYEDLAWFCASCWRFKHYHLGAGGLSREAYFLKAYAEARRIDIDIQCFRYWKIFSLFRWLAISLQQGWRHRSTLQQSLELLLTPYISYELQHLICIEIELYHAKEQVAKNDISQRYISALSNK